MSKTLFISYSFNNRTQSGFGRGFLEGYETPKTSEALEAIENALVADSIKNPIKHGERISSCKILYFREVK